MDGLEPFVCEAMTEGEDGLLIIQKEFDGFDGTRERLDLLALDRNGQLVVIENKLDDSGRDVVWQALKYAAYCSSLKKTEIVGIFQQYLDRHGSGDAASTICEFLGEDILDQVVLNDGTNQRIVFIAANFRREVTSTVLCLRYRRCTGHASEATKPTDIGPINNALLSKGSSTLLLKSLLWICQIDIS